MAFSGALTLADLNDFITPSQACIKPVEEVKPIDRAREPGAATTEIQIDSTGGYFEVSSDGPKARTKLQTAEISLNDCLACSGCITSAESVLISMQSHTEVLDFLSRNPPPHSPDHAIPVLSISPQSLASLAASISPPPTSSPSVSLARILARVRAFCAQKLGIDHVFDTTFARHIALQEHLAEFNERRASEASKGQLPMLAGACPGWICYAEKAHAEMLPFMSRTKSPQQVMGTLVKHWLGSQYHKTPDKMYHVTVMPCYDKKLEASRTDFYNEQYATRDVDCVLTTGELELMMREHEWDLRTPVANEGDVSPSSQGRHTPSSSSSSSSITGIPDLIQHPGSSSGSYLQSLIASLSTSASPDASATILSTRRIRSDYDEYVLKNAITGEIIFKGATCYGFRNLQNVVRKVGKQHGLGGRGAAAAGRMGGGRSSTGGSGVSLRAIARRRKAATNGEAASDSSAGSSRSTTPAPSVSSIDEDEREAARGYDYVEVMACPGGCVNGGGQLKAPSNFSSSSVDAEGYTRNWEASGVSTASTPSSVPHTPARIAPGQEPDMTASERWGDKEWTKRVEAAYWNVGAHGLATPPPSPLALAGATLPSSETASEFEAEKKSDAEKQRGAMANSVADVDALAQRIMQELGELSAKRGVLHGEVLRTNYRPVVSEVVGLAVKW
ncbi:iron hydrogenase [Clavulina sp. PMI_390]|nr:iron hydrogenase [Clavulina sp. PMI_390]